MPMERRWGSRKSLEADVVIADEPRQVLPGRIGNISMGGVFVETDSVGLRNNSQIEVVLRSRDDGTRVYRVPAMVVRITANGAGLMFDQYNVEAFRALVSLVLHQHPTTAEKNSHGSGNSAPVLGGIPGSVATTTDSLMPGTQRITN